MTRVRFLTLSALAASLTLAACDNTPPAAPKSEAPAAPAAPAFSHTTDADLSGYYLPTTDIAQGPYKLTHLFMGQTQEFTSWEGGQHSTTFGPVMLEFDDVNSPMVANEMGGEGHSITVRVLPSAYRVEDGRVHFEGSTPQTGAVTFDGRLDQDALATARRNLGGGEAPVLTGTLTLAGKATPAAFTWFGGD